MNFSVTCNDSGRTQRASGANSRRPSTIARDPAADVVVNIDRDKEAHEDSLLLATGG